MQPQEQIFVPAAAASWFGNEVLSLLQLIFFLTLGYAVTRTWIWTRHVTKVSIGKKLDDIDQIIEDIHGPSHSESDASPNTDGKTGSVQKRKKAKRAKEVSPEKLCAEDNVNNELDSLTHIAPTAVPVAPEETTQEVSAEFTIQEESPEETLEETPEEAAPEEVPAEEAQEETAQEENSKKTAQEEAQMSERVAKMLAKKVERKAKKAQEAEEQKARAKKEAADAALQKIEQAKRTALERKEVKLTKLDLAKLAASVQKEKALVEERSIEPECELAALDADAAEVRSSTLEGISTPERCLSPVDPLSWCSSAAQPTMPENALLLSPGAMAQPMMQEMPCVMSPSSRVPQIEGFMAVCVPAEFAPVGAPGPFDGLWTNAALEKIVIDHSDILFESGMKWVMQMHSGSNFSVEVGGEAFHGEMDLAGQQIMWSDGDLWTCVGQTDGQQQWAASRETGNMPPMVFEGAQFFAPMDNNQLMAPMEVMPVDNNSQWDNQMVAPMAPMENNQLIPEDAKSWELCWDWSKKGWCKRGSSCEWYHPPKTEKTYQPCMPCESAAPFSGFVDAPFGSQGPIY